MVYSFAESSFGFRYIGTCFNTQGQFPNRIRLHTLYGRNNHTGYPMGKDTLQKTLQVRSHTMHTYGVMVTQLQTDKMEDN